MRAGIVARNHDGLNHRGVTILTVDFDSEISAARQRSPRQSPRRALPVARLVRPAQRFMTLPCQFEN